MSKKGTTQTKIYHKINNIGKTYKEGNFTQMDNDAVIIAFNELTYNEFKVWYYLSMRAHYTKKDGKQLDYYDINPSEMATMLHIRIEKVTTAIKELVAKGYMTTNNHTYGNRQGKNGKETNFEVITYSLNPVLKTLDNKEEFLKEGRKKAHSGKYRENATEIFPENDEEIIEVEITAEPDICVDAIIADDDKEPESPLPKEDDFDFAEIFLSDSGITTEEEKQEEVEVTAKKDYFDCFTEQKDKEFAKEEIQIQPDDIYFLFVRDNHILDDFSDKEVADIISNGKRFGMISRDYVVNAYNNN